MQVDPSTRTPKACTKCKRVLPVSHFSPDRRHLDGLQSHCKECRAKYTRVYGPDRRAGTDRERIRQRLKARRFRDPIVRWLYDYKAARGCAQCPERCPEALDFHHLDRATKQRTIGRLQYRPDEWDAIQAELPKCIVLCANCHRKVHAGVLTLAGE